MKFFITCIYTFMKQLLSSKRYIISMLILPFIILFLFSVIPKNDYYNINIGIAYDYSSPKSNDIIDILSQSENFKYSYYDYKNIDEMERKIAANKLHMGYIISEDIDKKIENRDYKNIIIKIISPSSYLNFIIDEAICSSTIQVLTPYIADDYFAKSKIITYDENSINYLIESTSNYLTNGNNMTYKLFSNTRNIDSDLSDSYNVTILTFVCLSLSIFMLTSNILISILNAETNKKLYFLYYVACGNVYKVKLCSVTALSIVSLFFTLISLLIISLFVDITNFSILSVIVMFLSFAIFTSGLCSFIENYSNLSKFIQILLPAIVFGNFIFSGLLISSNFQGNIIGKISYIFPAKYFIHGLYTLNSDFLTLKSFTDPSILVFVGICLLYISMKKYKKTN